MDFQVLSEKPQTNSSSENFFTDSSLWSLVVINIVVTAVALLQGWALKEVMWIYAIQSVTIGILWFFKILLLREFSTDGFKINDRPVDPTASTKIQTAVFFLFHFGFFHVVYFGLLGGMFGAPETLLIVSMGGLFVISQTFSFFYNRKWITAGKPNIGKIMMFPYARILPMHLTIIFGGFLLDAVESDWIQTCVLAIFMFLKTLADALMHIAEIKGFADKR